MSIDKPAGWTSHDVVSRVRRILGERSVGHLGTLDPIATGVLPLLVGSSTRLARFYGDADKVYEASVRFGFATDTYDAEGEPVTETLPVILEREQLEYELKRFRGPIEQIPPRYSAKKVKGVPAYRYARRKQDVALQPVNVKIFSLELLEARQDEIVIRVHCSAGTYVRSIAHELGVAMGFGAHLMALRRLRSGNFSIDSAVSVARVEQIVADGNVREAITPAAELLPEFPVTEVDDQTAAQIRNGRDFHVSPFLKLENAKYIKAVTEARELLAIGQALLPNVFHPIVVLN